MKIYNAHPVTGEYLGNGFADADPLVDGNWLIPAHAYIDTPPQAGKNQAVVRNGDAWKVVDDFRGTVYYTDSSYPHVIEDLGVVVPDNVTDTPPPPTMAELTALAICRRDGLLGTATLRIAPLQDAVDLGTATDADVASLKLWKLYRVAVNRVSDQVGFPETLDWPAPPA